MFEELKTVAIYKRVSTTDQAREGHSLDEQLDRIKELCKCHGILEWQSRQ